MQLGGGEVKPSQDTERDNFKVRTGFESSQLLSSLKICADTHRVVFGIARCLPGSR
jgi:hypothetical protein